MTGGIPRAPLLLALAGLLPFLWGLLTLVSDPVYAFAYETLGGRFVGSFFGALGSKAPSWRGKSMPSSSWPWPWP